MCHSLKICFEGFVFLFCDLFVIKKLLKFNMHPRRIAKVDKFHSNTCSGSDIQTELANGTKTVDLPTLP